MRKSELERQELTEEEKPTIEKTDPLAMWLSGLLVIGVPCLVAVLVIVGVTMLLFGH